METENFKNNLLELRQELLKSFKIADGFTKKARQALSVRQETNTQLFNSTDFLISGALNNDKFISSLKDKECDDFKNKIKMVIMLFKEMGEDDRLLSEGATIIVAKIAALALGYKAFGSIIGGQISIDKIAKQAPKAVDRTIGMISVLKDLCPQIFEDVLVKVAKENNMAVDDLRDKVEKYNIIDKKDG